MLPRYKVASACHGSACYVCSLPHAGGHCTIHALIDMTETRRVRDIPERLVRISTSSIRPRLLRKLLEEHDYRCASCRCELHAAVVPSFVPGHEKGIMLFDVDHIRPVFKGQVNYFSSTDNAQPLCMTCHHFKTQTDMQGSRRNKRARLDDSLSASATPSPESESASDSASGEQDVGGE